MLSESFKPAKWRGTTAADGKTIGISFNLSDGAVVRYALDVESALALAETVSHYLDSEKQTERKVS